MAEGASFLLVLGTIFAIVDPVSNTVTYMALTSHLSPEERVRIGRKAALTGCILLLLFALAGEALLRYFGVDANYLRIAGGLLLLLVAVDMMQGRRSRESYTEEEASEAKGKTDFSIFPLAMPMLTGPGAITTVVIFMSGAGLVERGLVIGSILLTFGAVLLFFTFGERFRRVLGVSGSLVALRVMGLFLAAIAVQFIATGTWNVFRLLAQTS
ncbi:MAG: MarC family protein [Halobacteria archaeon]